MFKISSEISSKTKKKKKNPKDNIKNHSQPAPFFVDLYHYLDDLFFYNDSSKVIDGVRYSLVQTDDNGYGFQIKNLVDNLEHIFQKHSSEYDILAFKIFGKTLRKDLDEWGKNRINQGKRYDKNDYIYNLKNYLKEKGGVEWLSLQNLHKHKTHFPIVYQDQCLFDDSKTFPPHPILKDISIPEAIGAIAMDLINDIFTQTQRYNSLEECSNQFNIIYSLISSAIKHMNDDLNRLNNAKTKERRKICNNARGAKKEKYHKILEEALQEYKNGCKMSISSFAANFYKRRSVQGGSPKKRTIEVYIGKKIKDLK
ncbi:hypothetical protein HT667_09355 [Ursidibacter maritimus]|uniref:hypothetical protein n=1 Tax=Ursidibacter maritimus TaxID=1331689 RepID=UPI001C484BEA|nr:hypothetical protein [Ursidibacter maritimus]MBV6541654.1 hypothetical protein [Ursidibacter maritimus]